MAIKSLEQNPHPTGVRTSDAIGANVEALALQGLVHDGNREAVTEEVTSDFQALGRLGIAGEMFVAISQTQLPLSQRIAVLDELTQAKYGKDHPETFIYRSLWVPGTERGSYTDEVVSGLGPEYDGRLWAPHGRVILPNPDSPNEPILHYLNQPFDGKYAAEGEQTQLEAIVAQKLAFEAQHPEANLNPLTVRDIAHLAVVRLVKGEPLPLEWGFMRDATLPRTTVGGISIVGDVYSNGGQLWLGRSDGDALSYGGVGVSMGLNELEPEAS